METELHPDVPAAGTGRVPRRVIVTSRYRAAHRERLKSLFHPAEIRFPATRDTDAIRRALADADIAILREPPDVSVPGHPRLSWVHCNRSGLDACATRPFVESNLILTSASGRSAAVLAEHAIFFMLAFAYNAAAKRGALLVNVARSRLMNTSAFKHALRTGVLAGAGLDVADREPLPPWDELWGIDDLLITPHVTPRVADRETAEIDIIEDNYRRYLTGVPMRNRLGPDDLYTHPRSELVSRRAQGLIRLWGRLAGPAARRM